MPDVTVGAWGGLGGAICLHVLALLFCIQDLTFFGRERGGWFNGRLCPLFPPAPPVPPEVRH